jgi:predicted enzyme related to lactoylglutathione lyase
MIKEIAFTGTSVTDMKRARAFYEETLGLKPSEEIAGGKWIEYTVGNGTFAITNINPKWTPSDHGTAVGFEVDDFEKTNAELKKRGTRYWLEPS